MTEENELRRRKLLKSSDSEGSIKGDESRDEYEFKERESPLTVLFASSLHIRAIYHIFIAILMILFFDTVLYDIFEEGKINVGIRTVINGFGDMTRTAKLWLIELLLSLSFYPALRVYAKLYRILWKSPALRRLWSAFGLIIWLSIQSSIIVIPILELSTKPLALASAAIVTLEMIRFAMKVHAVCIASIPRIDPSSKLSLPSFKQYLYFLFAPTLIYRDQYPRTKKIRKRIVAGHFMEVAAIIFYNSFLWERFILPYWSDYGKETRVEVGKVIRAMFACILPGIISFLCGFYCLLHAWMNAFAEIMTFADRLFYEEWWTKSHFSRYIRAWNRVVHFWLRDHIYTPLKPKLGRAFATFVVFFVSSVAHEVVLMLSFGFFYPVLLIEFGVFGMLGVPLTAKIGTKYPNIINSFMWMGFLVGNGILWSLYSMEYFARINCPPSESDSFFVPKSWSCPELVLKPNWNFDSPFDLFF